MKNKILSLKLTDKPISRPLVSTLLSTGIFKIFDMSEKFLSIYQKNNNEINQRKNLFLKNKISKTELDKFIKQSNYLKKERLKPIIKNQVLDIIDFCLKNSISVIILGFSPERRSNPSCKYKDCFEYFREQLFKYSYQLNISLFIVSEYYCSNASFLDNEMIPLSLFKKPVFSGKLINKSTFKTKNGKYINADINSCLNYFKTSNILKESNLVLLRNKFKNWSFERI